MKIKRNMAILLGVMFIAALGAGIFMIGGGTKGELQALPLSCKIIKPTWAYYSCIKIDDAKSSDTLQWKGTLTATPVTISSPLTCTQLDVIDKGSQSCKYTVLNINNPALGGGTYINSATQKASCTGCAIENGQTKLKVGSTFWVAFGESPVLTSASLYGDGSVTLEKTYSSKTLHKISWDGSNVKIGDGCDLRTLGVDTAKLPAGSNLGMNVGDTINFIEGFIEVPTIGNYWQDPTYGAIVVGSVGPPYPVYQINPIAGATKDAEGKYTTTGGTCYFTADVNPITTWSCYPGQAMSGKTCVNGQIVDVDKGVCVRGGIANNQLCPGSGSTYCDLATHQAGTYTCNLQTGMCDATNMRSITCCPATNQGCTGDQYCDALSYTCKAKGAALSACPFDWCKGATQYLDKDCTGGLLPCPDVSTHYGSCKASCGSITPPDTGGTKCTPENYNVGGYGGLLKTPCCPYAADGKTTLIEDDKGYCRLNTAGQFDWNMIMTIGWATAIGVVVGLIFSGKNNKMLFAALGGLIGIAFGASLVYLFQNSWWIVPLIVVLGILLLVIKFMFAGGVQVGALNVSRRR